jgi:hypothetical protein
MYMCFKPDRFVIVDGNCYCYDGVEAMSLWQRAANGPFVHPPDDTYIQHDTGKRKPVDSEKPCPTANTSATNLTWTDLGPNPGPQGETPATV